MVEMAVMPVWAAQVATALPVTTAPPRAVRAATVAMQVAPALVVSRLVEPPQEPMVALAPVAMVVPVVQWSPLLL